MKRTLAIALLCLSSCRLTPLPDEPPPLRDMEAPLALQSEPDDEAQRLLLAPGSFTGVTVKSAWFDEPDEPGQAPDALEVVELVENSPGIAAGLRVGQLDLDRAGVLSRARIVPVPRIAVSEREGIERFREEQRAGIILRTATEVEARSAGLGAGGGAVLIGMASNSPWRQAGLQFGDLIIRVGDQSVVHPQVVLAAIRTTDAEAGLAVEYRRGESTLAATVDLTEREQEISSISLQPLYSYRSSRGKTSVSFLLGLFSYESTSAAWEFGFLWLFGFGGGDSDRLEEVRR
ncbi:MAG: hypothetical protein ACYTG5_13730 [Planctomycetota bacterium]|jgi:hypothetical protein